MIVLHLTFGCLEILILKFILEQRFKVSYIVFKNEGLANRADFITS